MLEVLFENIKVYGRYVKTNRLDYFENWNRIINFIEKPEQSEGLKDINNVLYNNVWNFKAKINSLLNSNINEIYNYVHDELKILGEEKDKNIKNIEQNKWEQYNIFLELIRIPINNSNVDLKSLVKIAYNLGQLSVCLYEKNSIFDLKAIDFFKINDLDKMESYIKIDNKQKKELETKLSITDLIVNTNSFVIEQMNLFQTGGDSDVLEPFYSEDVEELTKSNEDYRRVIYTGKNQQFVLMSIPPNDDIKMEVHENHDQFLRIEEGEGKALIGNTFYKLKNDTALIIPAGMKHKIINTSDSKYLKLYTIYSPPEHPDKLIEKNNPNKKNDDKNYSEEKIMSDTPTDDLISQKIIENELKEYETNQKGGYNLNFYEKNDFKSKYYYYKNNYIMLKKFISKYY